jgi:hypothetical protein
VGPTTPRELQARRLRSGPIASKQPQNKEPGTRAGGERRGRSEWTYDWEVAEFVGQLEPEGVQHDEGGEETAARGLARWAGLITCDSTKELGQHGGARLTEGGIGRRTALEDQAGDRQHQ